MEEKSTKLSALLTSHRLQIAIGVTICLFVAALYFTLALLQREDGFRLPVRPAPVESPQEKVDRLAIMNLLNQFMVGENRIPEGASIEERKELNLREIARTSERLRMVQPEQTLVAPRDELLAAFDQWRVALESDQSTRIPRQSLRKIAATYPWLDTLVWLIILNRL